MLGRKRILLSAALLLGLAAATWAQYIIETKGKYYHRMNCPLLRNMKIDEWQFVRTPRAASLYHKHPCPHCKPPVVGPAARSFRPRLTINYVADMNRRLYHRVGCAVVEDIKKEDALLLGGVKELQESRCRPCPRCKPFTWQELEEFNKRADEGFERSELSANMPSMVVSANLEMVRDVIVPGNVPSVNTNVRIQEGQIVLFSATGRIQTESQTKPDQPPPIWGPEGGMVDGKRKYCLVAAVGDEVHVVGERFGARFKRSGLLYLGFRDDPNGYENNQGAFRVRFTVWTPEGRPQPPDTK